MTTYREDLEKKLENLREKLSKAKAAENFSETAEGAILLDHIQQEVNDHFKAMSEGLPLEREEYLVRHAALTIYRGMAKAIYTTAQDKDRLEEELNDTLQKLKLED